MIHALMTIPGLYVALFVQIIVQLMSLLGA